MTNRVLAYIPRRADQPEIEGLYADGATLARLAAGPDVAVADLTRGAWRPHQVAHEFAAGLGFAPPPAHEADGAAPSSDDAVARWIDAEARGDAAVVGGLARAEDLARRIAARGRPVRLVVLAPRFGGD